MPTTFTDGTVLTGPALTAALATATADAAAAAPVTSVAGRTGVITLAVADVAGAYASANPAGYITGASPALTGTPTAPTATTGNSTTQIATTAFVAASVVAATTGVATFNTRSGAVTLTSGDVTSALTFTPYSAANPTGYQTASQVTAALPVAASVAPLIDGIAAVGSSALYARQDHVHPTDTSRAPLASPGLTGTPTAPTAANTTANTQIATTAFVRTATATNNNASAGQVGEYISSTVLIGSAVSLTNNTAANITSISLTAGDWDVCGTISDNPAGSTVSQYTAGWISTTSATQPTIPNSGAFFSFSATRSAGLAMTASVGTTRLSLATTTTVYLSVIAGFTTSTESAYGFIGARRAR